MGNQLNRQDKRKPQPQQENRAAQNQQDSTQKGKSAKKADMGRDQNQPRQTPDQNASLIWSHHFEGKTGQRPVFSCLPCALTSDCLEVPAGA